MSILSAEPPRRRALTNGMIVRRDELDAAIVDLECFTEWLDHGNTISRERLVTELRSACRALRSTMRRPESGQQ